MTAQETRDPTSQKLVDFVDLLPEWARPALLAHSKRIAAGCAVAASAQRWRDERAEAEADFRLKELIRGLADEEKPKAIRFLKRLVREAKS